MTMMKMMMMILLDVVGFVVVVVVDTVRLDRPTGEAYARPQQSIIKIILFQDTAAY